MRIQLRGMNNLFTFRNEDGQLCSVNLADFSGRINFRQVVSRYLKEQNNLAAIRTLKHSSSMFLALMERPLTALDILKIALAIERR